MQKNFSLAWRSTYSEQLNNDGFINTENSVLIKKILKNSNALKQLSVVVCLSSLIIDNNSLLNNFAENVEILSGIGLSFTIIHDYKGLIMKYLNFFDINKEQYSLRFGNEKSVDLLEMIISGYINKRVVSKLCYSGLSALGFSGKDGSLIVAKKSRDSIEEISKIFTGEPFTINPEILFEIEDTKIIPIISPVSFNDKGKTMILDTELTAAMIASAISANKLLIMCDNSFLLNEVKTIISINELDKLLDNSLEINDNSPLIRASRYALLNSETEVHFVDPRNSDSVLMSIFG